MPTEPTRLLGMSRASADAIPAQLLLDRCHDLIGDQDYPRAAAAAQQTTDPGPNQPNPYVAMAQAMTSMDCREHAVEVSDKAYQRTQPDKQYEILKGRAYTKHCNADYIGTIDDLTEMIALQPENAKCYIRRDTTRAEVAHYQGAIDDFDKAAEISELDAELHNLLAHAHMHAAFAQLDDNVDPDNARPARELAQKAFRQFQKELDLDPQHTQADQGSQLLRTHLPCLGLVSSEPKGPAMAPPSATIWPRRMLPYPHNAEARPSQTKRCAHISTESERTRSPSTRRPKSPLKERIGTLPGKPNHQVGQAGGNGAACESRAPNGLRRSGLRVHDAEPAGVGITKQRRI